MLPTDAGLEPVPIPASRVPTARTPAARPLVVSTDEELLDDLLRLLAAALSLIHI